MLEMEIHFMEEKWSTWSGKLSKDWSELAKTLQCSWASGNRPCMIVKGGGLITLRLKSEERESRCSWQKSLQWPKKRCTGRKCYVYKWCLQDLLENQTPQYDRFLTGLKTPSRLPPNSVLYMPDIRNRIMSREFRVTTDNTTWSFHLACLDSAMSLFKMLFGCKHVTTWLSLPRIVSYLMSSTIYQT